MQLFPCPFCGTRDETEFRYVAETGKTRPPDDRTTAAADWAAYLYMQANHKGDTREVWCHLTCGELFVMNRNNVSHVVAGATALRGSGQEGAAHDATADAAAHDLGAA